MAPFQLVWSDISNNILTKAWFPVGFPAITSTPLQLQVRSNAADLQTYETLKDVKLFLTGDAGDINIVQNTWPTLGGATRPELSGGIEISFDFGRTYTRFTSTVGLESNTSTWISLPPEAVGVQGQSETLGAFDTAHMIVRYVIPPGVTDFKEFNISLGMEFDII